MNNDADSNSSRDLLARLNALKRSPIDLDQTSFSTAYIPPSEPAVGHLPLPRSVHTDLVDRFKNLSAKAGPGSAAQATEKSEDDKTVEELLADLGPVEEWGVHQSEHEQIEELLRAADVALAKGPVLENVPGDVGEQQEQKRKETAAGAPPLPSIDVLVFQPEPEAELDRANTDEEANTAATRHTFDREADDVLNRLLDEVRLGESQQQQQGAVHTDSKQPDDEAADPSNTQPADDSSLLVGSLPSAPSKLPTPPQSSNSKMRGDDDLASRFASLSLPSAPSAAVQSEEKRFGKTGGQGFTEDEIDSWCIICCDDATLSCIGCDGDLYCTNCWLEGHRGDAAGAEERTHKALQYVKGKKKSKAKRVAMRA